MWLLDEIERRSAGGMSRSSPEPEVSFRRGVELAIKWPSKAEDLRHAFTSNSFHLQSIIRSRTIGFVRAYRALVLAKSALGLYAVTRAALESHGFIVFFMNQLPRTFVPTDEEWRERGSDFYWVMLRARLCTANEKRLKQLESWGIERHRVRAPKIREMLQALSEVEGFSWAHEYYSDLCEVVHPNGQSRRAVQSRLAVGPDLGFGSKFAWGYDSSGPESLQEALQETAEKFLQSLSDILERQNRYAL
jgi:hypothetical protein